MKADPNSRRYIKRPCDHAHKYHFSLNTSSPCTSPDPPPPSASPTQVVKRVSIDPPDCTSFTKKKKSTLIGLDGQLVTTQSSTQVSDCKKVNVTIKNKKLHLKQMDASKLLDPKISIFNRTKNSMEDWAQNFSLSVVLSGVNKNISQATTVNLYETAHAGVKGYHKISPGIHRVEW